MNNKLQIILMFSIALMGCAHKITKYDNEDSTQFYKRVNGFIKDETVILLTTENDTVIAKSVLITGDSTEYVNLEDQRNYKMLTNNIDIIEYDEMGRGVFEGFAIGSLLGLTSSYFFIMDHFFLSAGIVTISGTIIGAIAQSKIKIILSY